jgi:hypothetical protein
VDGGWLRIRNRTGSVFNLLLRKSKFILFYVYSAAVLLLQPGELAKHAVSEGTNKAVTNPATGAIFLSNPEESEGRRGGGRGRTGGGSEGWDDR